MTKTDDDAAVHLHDMSVSGKPKQEAMARALKATADLSFDWLEAEHERGTDPLAAMQALIASHVSIAYVAGGTVSAHGDRSIALLRGLAETYRSAFLSFAAHLEREAKKQSGKP